MNTQVLEPVESPSGDTQALLPALQAKVDVMRAQLGPRVVTMPDFLAGLCAVQGCGFTLNGKPIEGHVVMAPQMFLPTVAWEAQHAGLDLLGIDFGCALRSDDEAMFGAQAQVPHVTGHITDVIRALFFRHATVNMFGIRPGASIEVRPMYELLRDSFRSVFAHATSSTNEGDTPWQPMAFPVR